ncbi:MAG: hypothetical protein U0525_05940 [Patescibacteria group bacterium]
MPQINNVYQLPGLTIEQLFEECKKSFEIIKITNYRETNESQVGVVKRLEGLARSNWTGAGMTLIVLVYEKNNCTEMQLNGDILQLATSPLAGVMDNFLTTLSKLLKEKYSYDFKFEKLNRFLPKYKINFTIMDKRMVVDILLSGLAILTVKILFGSRLITGIVIIFASCFVVAKIIYLKFFKNKA